MKKQDGNWLYDLVVLDQSNPDFDRMVTADKALVSQNGADINLDLYHMTVDPVDAEHNTIARANRFSYTLKDVIRKTSYYRRTKDFRLRELLGKIREAEESLKRPLEDGGGDDQSAEAILAFKQREVSSLKVEASKRLVFAKDVIQALKEAYRSIYRLPDCTLTEKNTTIMVDISQRNVVYYASITAK